MSEDDDRWVDATPPPRGPSAPPDVKFDPFATGLGVFAGVTIPIVVIGYTRAAGPNGAVIAIGVVVGLLAGIIAGIWVAHHDGRIWRGPRL